MPKNINKIIEKISPDEALTILYQLAEGDKEIKKQIAEMAEALIKDVDAENICDEVFDALNYMHGNPYFRLLRNEVESFVNEKYGEDYLKNKQLKRELSNVNREIRKFKKQLKSLEKEKAQLLAKIGE